MIKVYYLIFVCFVLISCKKRSGNDYYKNTEELKTAEDTLRNRKNIKVYDFFLELSKKLEQTSYSLKKINYTPNFKDIFNDFVTENKSLFGSLDLEREAVFELNNGKTSIYVREWVFRDVFNTKEVEKLINKPNRKVSLGELVLFVDTIKEPYFTFIRDESLYVFYVDNVGDSKHILFFESLLGNGKDGFQSDTIPKSV